MVPVPRTRHAVMVSFAEQRSFQAQVAKEKAALKASRLYFEEQERQCHRNCQMMWHHNH
ncbi:unnamed protein product, partial [Discosporangium mesarthrocarpum]